jgi:hypothetical protein
MLRILLLVIGGVLTFVGSIWFMQGINVIPGSFMTGQTRWAVNGALAAIGGIIVLAANWRRRR